jgi:hypothetical protein
MWVARADLKVDELSSLPQISDCRCPQRIWRAIAGVVTLKSTVSTRAEADRAVMLARETKGVTRVVNNLRVGGEARTGRPSY